MGRWKEQTSTGALSRTGNFPAFAAIGYPPPVVPCASRAVAGIFSTGRCHAHRLHAAATVCIHPSARRHGRRTRNSGYFIGEQIGTSGDPGVEDRRTSGVPAASRKILAAHSQAFATGRFSALWILRRPDPAAEISAGLSGGASSAFPSGHGSVDELFESGNRSGAGRTGGILEAASHRGAPSIIYCMQNSRGNFLAASGYNFHAARKVVPCEFFGEDPSARASGAGGSSRPSDYF